MKIVAAMSPKRMSGGFTVPPSFCILEIFDGPILMGDLSEKSKASGVYNSKGAGIIPDCKIFVNLLSPRCLLSTRCRQERDARSARASPVNPGAYRQGKADHSINGANSNSPICTKRLGLNRNPGPGLAVGVGAARFERRRSGEAGG